LFVWGTFVVLCITVTHIFSSPGHRPSELLSWVSIRPSVRPLAFHI
jgi:hypothetical protein